MDLQADFTWIVTATPVHNRLNDLYPLFNFLNIYTEFSDWNWSVLSEIKRSPKQGFARLQTLIKEKGERLANAKCTIDMNRDQGRNGIPTRFSACMHAVAEILSRWLKKLGEFYFFYS